MNSTYGRKLTCQCLRKNQCPVLSMHPSGDAGVVFLPHRWQRPGNPDDEVCTLTIRYYSSAKDLCAPVVKTSTTHG
eukprot:scaffold33695_cov24-Prasinocladus_malaysianus.AAC.1